MKHKVINVLGWFFKIKEYCETFEECPKSGDTIHKTKDGTTSDQLSNWCYRANFYKKNKPFKYEQMKLEDGTLVIDILNELFEKYGQVSTRSYESAVKMVNNIKEYCDTFGEWPRQNDNIHKTKDGTTSDQLSKWCYRVNFYQKDKPFKHIDLVDEKGIPVLDTLNNLYAILYNPNSKTISKLDEYNKNYNLKYASKSKELYLELYYIIIKLMNYYYKEDLENYNRYLELLKRTILDNQLNININDIINTFHLNPNEMLEYYYYLYTINSISNEEDLACLYKCLYHYIEVTYQADFQCYTKVKK